jgi:competence protein ComEC
MIPEAPAAPRQLSDLGAAAMAAATVAGAWWHPPLPLALGAVVAVLGLAARRPALVVLAAGLLAASLGHRAVAGLANPPAGRFEGVVTLVADPGRSAFGSAADVRLPDGARVQLRADGGAAGALESSLAGEQLLVEGVLRPPGPGSGWMVPRHLVGSLDAELVERRGRAAAPWRAANRFRRLLGHGASSLDPEVRALYAGFVLGDDRDQSVEVTDDFRGAGLTHVLVVSGQNVALVLVLVGPLLLRLGRRGRWVGALLVILAFATITRFEPSVLRASAMAALAVTGRAVGRPSPSHRTLALAVSALVLIDPLLVRSIGFALSVSASLALALLARPLADRIGGPKPVAEVVGAAIAAQVGVAPILIPFTGGLPVVSLPANVLAVPVAGLVTTYGLPAGVVAGVLGPGAGRWVHLPTELGVRWVAGVARVGAGLPLGELRAGSMLLLAAALGAALATARARRTVRRAVAATAVAVAAVVLVQPAFVLRHPSTTMALASGVEVLRAQGATVVTAPERGSEADLLADLRRTGIRRIDALVVDGDGSSVARLLAHRWAVGRVVDDRTREGRLRLGGVEIEVVDGRPPVARLRAGP